MEPKEVYQLVWSYPKEGDNVTFEIFWAFGEVNGAFLEEFQEPIILERLKNIVSETGVSYAFFIPESMELVDDLNGIFTFGVRTVDIKTGLKSGMATVTEDLDTRPRPQMVINLEVITP